MLPKQPAKGKKTTSRTQPPKLSRTQEAHAAFQKVGMPLHWLLRTKPNQVYIGFGRALKEGLLDANDLRGLGKHLLRHYRVPEQQRSKNVALVRAHVLKIEGELAKHKDPVKAYRKLMQAISGKKLTRPSSFKWPSKRFLLAGAAALALGLGAAKISEKALYHFWPVPAITSTVSVATGAKPLPMPEVPKDARNLFKWMEPSMQRQRALLLEKYEPTVNGIDSVMQRAYRRTWSSGGKKVEPSDRLRILTELHTHFLKSSALREIKLSEEPEKSVVALSKLHANPVAPEAQPIRSDLPEIVYHLYKPRLKTFWSPLPSQFFHTPQVAGALASHYEQLAGEFLENKSMSLKLRQLALSLKTHWLDLTEEDHEERDRQTKPLREDITKSGGSVEAQQPGAFVKRKYVNPLNFVVSRNWNNSPLDRLRALVIYMRASLVQKGDVYSAGSIPPYIVELAEKPLDPAIDSLVKTYSGFSPGRNIPIVSFLALTARELASELGVIGEDALSNKAGELSTVLGEIERRMPRGSHH